MIDFKKEVMKYQPAKTADDLQDSINLSNIKDLGEVLQYLALKGERIEGAAKGHDDYRGRLKGAGL